MQTNIQSVRRYNTWQFSLRSLMFVMTIVAICAALVQISIGLAVLLIPLIAAGLLRTIRVVGRDLAGGTADGPAPGMFVTFCRSLGLVVAMIGLTVATMAVGATAAVLLAAMLVVHIWRAVYPVCRPVIQRLWLVLLAASQIFRRRIGRIQPVDILRWLQIHAVVGTVSLIATGRRLFRQFWCRSLADARLENGHAS